MIKKRPKYGNKKVEYQGKLFDSKREMQRYVVLKEAEEKGLTVQEVQKVGERISRYVEIAEYNMKVNTKFNAPGCYLW